MVVFISWSGPRAKKLASGLNDWLRAVIQSLRPFMSETDIGAGTVWSDEIHERLKSSGFGIVCVTHENMESPWLNYEAGGLANAVSRPRVCPYVLRMKIGEVRGPLSRFQAKIADAEGTLELLRSINSVLSPESQLPDKTLDMMFAKFWPDLEKLINTIEETGAAPKPRPDADKIDEMLSLVRDLATRSTAGNLLYSNWQKGARARFSTGAVKNFPYLPPAVGARRLPRTAFVKGTYVMYRGFIGTIKGRVDDGADTYVVELPGGKDVVAAAPELEPIVEGPSAK